MHWRGVSVDTLLEHVRAVDPGAAFAIAWSDGGYTTNLPLADVLNGQAFVAYEYDGAPLAPEHGGPARLVVPHRYFWKSAKWVRGLRLRRRRRARLLGVARLPQPRRPVARRALQRRLRATRAMATAAAPSPGSSRRSPRSARRRRRSGRSRSTLPAWTGHRAGQHVDLRLTAEDGYSVERSYSIASEPERDGRSRSPSSASPTARSRRSSTTSSCAATGSSCAARSVATSSGRRRSAGRCSSSPAAPGSCR